MSKIAMFTMGTRGDIQPYIFLSRALISSGHEVTLGSHPCWQNLVESYGITFKPIGPDIDIQKEAAIIRGNHPNAAVSMLKTMNFVFKIIQNSTDEIYKACEGMDLIVVSHSQMGATEAEVLGIPTVNVTLQKEMIPESLKEKTFKDKMIGNMVGGQMVKPYNKIRKVYNLPPLNSSEELLSGKYDLIPISSHVLKRNEYWEPRHILTGYWFEDEPEYIPDEKLSAFLKAGDKPVILALGAMSFEDSSEKEKLDMFVNAFLKSGCRAIIQGFQKTLENYTLPSSMISVGSVPHSWLFKQGSFVIHHCGFGTAAATMIYGIPSIPIPHVLDQKGFAQQLWDCKVATKPLGAKDLSQKTIYNAICEMKADYSQKLKNAQIISEKIQNEGGLKEAVRLIEDALQ